MLSDKKINKILLVHVIEIRLDNDILLIVYERTIFKFKFVFTIEKKICNKGLFTCKTLGKCIHKSWVCDNQNDCPDHSDETNCTGNIILLFEDEFFSFTTLKAI